MNDDPKPISVSKWVTFCLILAGFFVMTSCTIITGVAGIRDLHILRNANGKLYNDGVLAVRYADDINLFPAQIRSSLHSLVVETEPAKMQSYRQEIEINHAGLKEAEKNLMELVKGYPNRKRRLDEATAAREEYYAAIAPAIDLAMAGRRTEAWNLINSEAIMTPTYKLIDRTHTLADFVMKRAQDTAEENSARAEEMQTTIMILISITILAAFACSIIIGMAGLSLHK